MKPIQDAEQATRLEVIGNTGRLLTKWNLNSILVSVQDDGRTVKIFIDEEVEEEIMID
jgi:hypothetical protein